MKQRQLYSLFLKQDRNWKRVSPISLTLMSAQSIFQNALLAGASLGIQIMLRPVQDSENPAPDPDARLIYEEKVKIPKTVSRDYRPFGIANLKSE